MVVTDEPNATEHEPASLNPEQGDWFLGTLVTAANNNDTRDQMTGRVLGAEPAKRLRLVR